MPHFPRPRIHARQILAWILASASLAFWLFLPAFAGRWGQSPALAATTFTVSNTNDSGAGSFRQAILNANANAGLDTITFSIGSGVQTIAPLSDLPAISDPVIIDGTTQPGFNGAPIIELKGNSDTIVGLRISASNSTVRGLVINRFIGMNVSLGGGGNKVKGNYIGTDVTGNLRLDGSNGIGIRIASSNNIIGGTLSGDGNLISGNNGSGIDFWADTGEVISGNLIQGNLIGTNAAGTAALPNSENGVHLSCAPGACQNNTIGGTAPGAGNVISGNGMVLSAYSGIRIEGPTSTGNVVQGNLIGVNAAGTASLRNGYHGIEIVDAPGTIIGGTMLAARNVISGNGGDGISIGAEENFARSSGNTVQGNFIGTGADGNTHIPNANPSYAQGGITIRGSNNIIGGTASGAGNLIAFNGFDDGAGVQVAAGTGNTIRGNSIFSTNGLGIELVPYGVTANDPNDTDAGVNDRQNFPVITSVTPGGSSTTIQGTLNSTPNTSFGIDFYASSACDPSGNGEGSRFLGSSNVTTAGNGNASFNVSLPVVLSAGQVVTATATNPAGNTSEFSACGPGAATGQVQFNASSFTGSESSGTGNVIVTRTGGSTGTIVVNYATSDNTAIDGQDYVATAGTLTFNDGETSKSFSIQILEDSLDESSETINLRLSAPTDADTITNPAVAALNISDNDPTPGLSIDDVSVVEGHTGTIDAVFTVSLSAVSGRKATVQFQTFNGTATASQDYTGNSGVLTFNPGVTTKTITVQVKGDTAIEPDETFNVILHTPSSATLVDDQGIGTILTDDFPPAALQFSATGYNVAENGGSVAITIKRTGSASGQVSVSFAASNGTATSGSDYTTVSQTVTFADGDATDKIINIPVTDDTEYEGPETVNLTLTNPTGGATLGDPNTATLTINDTSPVPTTLVVNTTNDIDDGYCNALHCSLREAIGAANNSAGANTISFNIPGSGVKTITPSSNLPAITDQVTIDGYTQPGAHSNTQAVGDDAVLLIELDGSAIQAQATGVGLDLAAGNSTVRGLVINRFNLYGIRSQSNPGSHVIEGNFIGTSADGHSGLGNGSGLLIDSSDGNTIGGITPAARNVISGNLASGIIIGGDSSGNQVQGNFIGTKANGTSALGNGAPDAVGEVGGININAGTNASNNMIGGTASEAGNVIAFNSTYGVHIFGGEGGANGNAVLSNSIFFNANGLGIDLGSYGVAANDEGDADSGPNNLQNFPVVSSALIDGGSTTIEGTLNSTASTELRLEFFSNDACDESGQNGEGQTFIGSTTVTTDASGNASFTFIPQSPVAGGQVITASATGPSNNTSEFSPCFTVSTPMGTLQFSTASYAVEESGSMATITVSRTGGSVGAVSVQYATAGGGTALAESDFTTMSGTLEFADGQTSNTFTIPILEDSLDEASETVNLTLSNPTNGASLGSPSTAILTISDNDQTPSLSVDDLIFTGANSLVSEVPAGFKVNLSAASGHAVTLQYATADGTATAGSDYTATSGTLTFEPGETSKTIAVTILGDAAVEPDETFFLNLTNPTHAGITDAQGMATIPNDDHRFSISGRVLINTTALSGVTVKLSGTKTATVTTDNLGHYAFANLDAGGNYTVTPSKINYTFTPASHTHTNLSANQTQNFAATLKTYTIGGVIKLGATGLSGVTVKLTSPTPAGFAVRTVQTNSAGAYSFTNVPATRNYTVTPTKTGYQFTPVNKSIANLSGNQAAVNFAVKVYSISGRVMKNGTTTGLGSVTMTITSPTPAGFAVRTVQTNSTGTYTFTNLPAGRSYTIKPTKTGFTFTPATRTITNLNTNVPAGATTSFAGK